MAYERPLTYAEAKNRLYKHATDDFDDTDGTFGIRLNEALERIYTEGIWEGLTSRMSVTSYITDEVLSLPYAYEAMLSIAIDDVPYPIMGKQYEFMQGGPGVEDAGKGGSFIVDLGFDASSGQSLRKYKILSDIQSSTTVEGILKRRFVYLTADADEVFPSNLGALKHALLAITYEDEGDIQRSSAFWDECYAILNSAKQVNLAGVHNPNPQQQWGFMTNKPYGML